MAKNFFRSIIQCASYSFLGEFKMGNRLKAGKYFLPDFFYKTHHPPKIFYQFLPFLPIRIREKINEAVHLLTYYFRPLPDFVIVGAQRSGTTSLYNYLIDHPLILPADNKEIHYFDIHYPKGIKWYRSNFPSLLYRNFLKILFRHRNLTMEASPYYIFHPVAIRRMYQLIPHAKIILILRNPIDRAYSHYQRERRRGYEHLSFEEALDREEERLEGEEDKIREIWGYESYNHKRFAYVSRGVYIKQVKRLLKYYPRDQVLILIHENFYNDPQKNILKVCDFLNLPYYKLKFTKKYLNQSYSKMDKNIKERLEDFYEPFNKELSDYLGIELNW